MTMSVYVVLIQDRHTDPELAVFQDESEALAHTRRRFAEVVAFPESILENSESSYLLYLYYSLESDYALCQKCTLRGEH